MPPMRHRKLGNKREREKIESFIDFIFQNTLCSNCSFIFHCRASLHLHELVHCRWVEEVTQVCFYMDVTLVEF